MPYYTLKMYMYKPIFTKNTNPKREIYFGVPF